MEWMVFHTPAQFRELMALLRSFEDQVSLIQLRESPGLQFQDLLSRPLRQRSITRRGSFENAASAAGGWQVRLLDLSGAIARTHLTGAPVRFNLLLQDPIADLLDEGAPWRGIGGEYVVEFGEESSATPGQDHSCNSPAGLMTYGGIFFNIVFQRAIFPASKSRTSVASSR